MTTARVKICGITNEEDALEAVKCGADALGFIFHEPSPRYIAPSRAREIIKILPPFVSSVGLFVNVKTEIVQEAIRVAGIDLLQFHGEEDEKFCLNFEKPWIKTIKVGSKKKYFEEICRFSKATAFLFDTDDSYLAGGTGRTFDWLEIPKSLKKPFVVAGGLTPSNVQRAVRLTNPFAVDVCSGVEIEKGKKDINKMKEFIFRAKNREK